MFQIKNDPYYAPYDWAHELYEYLDNFYKSKIFDPYLRKLFIKGLAIAWDFGDKEFKNEIEKTGFTKAHYWAVFNDEDEIKKCYLDYIQNEFEIYHT